LPTADGRRVLVLARWAPITRHGTQVTLPATPERMRIARIRALANFIQQRLGPPGGDTRAQGGCGVRPFRGIWWCRAMALPVRAVPHRSGAGYSTSPYSRSGGTRSVCAVSVSMPLIA
jgi:hypothetical protein